MKSNFLFVLLLISTFHIMEAQSFVVQYEYEKRVMKDSSETVSQNVYLNIDKEQSMFFSEAPYLADSIMTADEEKGKKINFKALPVDILTCFIQKKLSKKEVTYYSNEFIEHEYKYVEKPLFNWKISDEAKDILGYKTYLATTNYAGRNYIAYYTPEIPVQEGPYKFFGLPGLILEVFDDKKDHHFLAIGISKEKKINVDNQLSRRKFIETSKKSLLKSEKIIKKLL